MHILMKTKFGSHLYGTDTPNSDLDYKGVYLPSPREMFLNKIPKSITKNTSNNQSKNTCKDIDHEIYSLHYFLDLALKGETAALDMLHASQRVVDSIKSLKDK